MAQAPRAYPLQWPPGWPRTLSTSRQKWPNSVTVTAALGDLEREMRLLGVRQIVLSSDVTLGVSDAPDPGVVAYGILDGQQIAIPCDRWTTVAANVRAIAKTVEAMRGMQRWGAKHMIRAMFQGFTAIAPPNDWRTVLGLDGAVTTEQVRAKQRELALRHHPDRGGDAARMAEINDAADRALRELAA